MAAGNIGGVSFGSGGMITDDAAFAAWLDENATELTRSQSDLLDRVVSRMAKEGGEPTPESVGEMLRSELAREERFLLWLNQTISPPRWLSNSEGFPTRRMQPPAQDAALLNALCRGIYNACRGAS